MKKNMEELFVEKRIASNKEIFDIPEIVLIQTNIKTFTKVYKIAYLDAKKGWRTVKKSNPFDYGRLYPRKVLILRWIYENAWYCW